MHSPLSHWNNHGMFSYYDFWQHQKTNLSQPDTTEDPGDTNVAGASLYYNEYICYDIAQVRLRYLLRVKM